MNPPIPVAGFRALMAAALFGVLAASLGVVAVADPDAASRTVRFADLNVSRSSDARVLYMRVRAAAQVVCSHYFLATDTDKARCVRDATADAVTKINLPALSALYAAKGQFSVSRGLVSQSR